MSDAGREPARVGGERVSAAGGQVRGAGHEDPHDRGRADRHQVQDGLPHDPRRPERTPPHARLRPHGPHAARLRPAVGCVWLHILVRLETEQQGYKREDAG